MQKAPFSRGILCLLFAHRGRSGGIGSKLQRLGAFVLQHSSSAGFVIRLHTPVSYPALYHGRLRSGRSCANFAGTTIFSSERSYQASGLQVSRCPAFAQITYKNITTDQAGYAMLHGQFRRVNTFVVDILPALKDGDSYS
jgi:hypothetical protein